LIAVGYNPLFKGVNFLVHSNIDEFTSAVDLQKEAFEQFKMNLENMWSSENESSKADIISKKSLSSSVISPNVLAAEVVDLFESVLLNATITEK